METPKKTKPTRISAAQIALLVFATVAVLVTSGLLLRSYNEVTPETKAVRVPLDQPLTFQKKSQSLGNLLTSDKNLLIFWATWCEPCVEEIRSLPTVLPKLLAKGYHPVFINNDNKESLGLAEEFAKQNKIETAFDLSGQLLYSIDVTSLPTSMVVDKTGKIIKVIWGAIDEAEL